jgi:hypothetical protein
MQRELREQSAVVYYLNRAYPQVLYTASAGGAKTSKVTAGRLKISGYMKGCPDLMIFEPSGVYHGLFIEMKAPAVKGLYQKGKASPEQLEWIDKLKRRGYRAVICYGFGEAKEVLDGYFKGEVI